MTENEKRKEGDDLMTCFVIHVSLLSLHIFRNSCFTKRLVVYHPLTDLNSIELIWATMKGYIARRNVSFKMTDVIQLTHDAIAAVTEDDWASSCRHVEEVERKYWDADIAVEAEMEKIVIQLTSSDEDTDTATECSDYSDTESADEECLC